MRVITLPSPLIPPPVCTMTYPLLRGLGSQPTSVPETSSRSPPARNNSLLLFASSLHNYGVGESYELTCLSGCCPVDSSTTPRKLAFCPSYILSLLPLLFRLYCPSQKGLSFRIMPTKIDVCVPRHSYHPSPNVGRACVCLSNVEGVPKE